MKTRFDFIATVLFVLSWTGCGGTNVPPDLPKLVTCQITVRQEGKPLAEASVFLAPQDGSKWNASGNTDARGVAEMFTHGMYQGVAEGKYKVVVSKNESTDPPLAPTGQPQEKQQHFTRVEEIYADAVKTPLAIEVVRGTREYTADAGKAVRIQLPER
ncbi:MAG: hypothetical protein LBQ54_16650 [Planctomycetaceae bacterium]|nr:hypothetical protein [Planctomycetaceae bacterium]